MRVLLAVQTAERSIRAEAGARWARIGAHHARREQGRARMAGMLARVRRGTAIMLALAALVMVGALIALAAPGHGGGARPGASGAQAGAPITTTATATPTDTRQNVVPLVQTGSTPIPPTPTATPPATATATSQPTPTATAPSPTATPIPPSPTPAPTWHTVGTYSGSSAGTFATLASVQGPLRIDWTCSIPGNGGITSWSLGWIVNGPTGGGRDDQVCDASHLSGTSSLLPCSGTPCQVMMVDQADAAGAWTATLEELY